MRRSAEPTAAAEVLKVIEGQLADARSTAASLQTRSTAIVSSCGALIALFLGLAGIVTAGDDYTPPPLSAGLLAFAVLLFAGSGVFVLLVARPVRTGMFELDSLRSISRDDVLQLPARQAYPEIAKAHIEVLAIARDLNTTVSLQVLWASILGIAGVVAAAVGAAYALIDGFL